MRTTEHWIEINLMAEPEVQNTILLDVLRPYVERLRESGTLLTWHYFREPEIRFRIRVRSKKAKMTETVTLAELADRLAKRKLISSWHFGSHGETRKNYIGEEDRYGRNGWKVAQEYFERGAETALGLLELRRESKLENPLWARRQGNPWEGGDKNPWQAREDDPLIYHWSRYVHLFSSQIGFNIDKESKLCEKQAQRYRLISKELGVKW